MSENFIKTYVWSKKIRAFHWLNVLTILLLVIIGVVILNAKLFGISTEGKILLKTLHVSTGYVFAINLIIRIFFGFFGQGFEKWSQTLPFFKGYKSDLKAFREGQSANFKGHNPVGKLMVAALLTCMTVQMVTGLVIAGTDIYYPPFGQHFAKSIAIDKTDLTSIKPYSKVNVDKDAYKEMRAFRKPFITTHVYAFYLLIFLIPLHILAVIVAERKEKQSIVSSMIHGYKVLPSSDITKSDKI